MPTKPLCELLLKRMRTCMCSRAAHAAPAAWRGRRENGGRQKMSLRQAGSGSKRNPLQLCGDGGVQCECTSCCSSSPWPCPAPPCWHPRLLLVCVRLAQMGIGASGCGRLAGFKGNLSERRSRCARLQNPRPPRRGRQTNSLRTRSPPSTTSHRPSGRLRTDARAVSAG